MENLKISRLVSIDRAENFVWLVNPKGGFDALKLAVHKLFTKISILSYFVLSRPNVTWIVTQQFSGLHLISTMLYLIKCIDEIEPEQISAKRKFHLMKCFK